MSILTDISSQEQLTIESCFKIDASEYSKHLFSKQVVESMEQSVYKALDERYGGEDIMKSDLFPTIYNDIPELMFTYLHDNGHITGARKEDLLMQTHRDIPFWGVPEVPQFMLQINTNCGMGEAIWFHVHVTNLIWGATWKGVDPQAYHKFIQYMKRHWRSHLQFCYNPDPWETLKDILANPDKYKEYEYTL